MSTKRRTTKSMRNDPIASEIMKKYNIEYKNEKLDKKDVIRNELGQIWHPPIHDASGCRFGYWL